MIDPKRCNRCGKLKPISQFSKAKGCIDGHRGYCNQCMYDSYPKVEVTCPVCKITFLKKRSSSQKFCSTTCAYRGKRYGGRTVHTISLVCNCCGKNFERPVGNRNGERVFCSIPCRTKYLRGKHAPGWNGGTSRAYQYGYHTKKYKDWRISVFERDNYTCQICGVRGTYLHAHHIKGFTHFPRFRYLMSNGITLCKKCHMEVHSLCKGNKHQNSLMEKLRTEAQKIPARRKPKDKDLMQSV